MPDLAEGSEALVKRRLSGEQVSALERVDLRDRFYGLRIGARAGEGFVADNAFALRDASALL